MSRYNDLQRLDKPPTTKQLQRHFGLSRKQAVRFHKNFSNLYTPAPESAAEYHTHTFKLAAEVKQQHQNEQDKRRKSAKPAKEVPSV
jgi:hypothetical protein